MAAEAGDVLVVGSLNVDFVVRVGRLPAPGETVTGGIFERHGGGKGANQAVAAARLGASVTFVGAVGRDEPGRVALEELRGEKIDVSRVALLDGVATGVAVIVVDDQGENQIAVASGANAALDAETVELSLDDCLLAAGSIYLANLEIADSALLAGAGFAARAGARLLINVAPARPLPAELLRLRPILLFNEREAEALSGEGEADASARALTDLSRAPVIVTLGRLGALLLEEPRANAVRIPAPPTEAVDATGAGDAFAGALAAELARGSELHQAAALAVRAASLSVRAPGARTGMPTRSQLEERFRTAE